MVLRGIFVLSILSSLCHLRVHTILHNFDDITCLAVNEDVYYNITRDGRTQDIPNVTIHDGPLYPNVFYFDLLVRQCHLFVDKTLFLYDLLLTPHKNIILTYPRKWGKSVNLDMIRYFLQMEVDFYGNYIDPENGTEPYNMFVHGELRLDHKLRKPLLISKHRDFIYKNLGRHPVVYVDLFITNLVNRGAVERRIEWSLCKAFHSHYYMLDVFETVINDTSATAEQRSKAEDAHELFGMMMHRQADKETWNTSIRFLCDVLHQHFKKKVYLLLDDYDSFINYLTIQYTNPDRDEMLEYYLDFLKTTIIDNPHIERVIATGVMSIGRTRFANIFAQFHEYYYLDGSFMQYFAYHEREVRLIEDYVDLTTGNRTVLDEWCNGYKVNLSCPRRIYNPQSVNSFIERGAADFPWAKPMHILFEALLPYFMDVPGYESMALNQLHGYLEVVVPKFMKIPGFEELWCAMLTGSADYTITITDTLQFTYDKWLIIEDALKHPLKNTKTALETAFHYLFANALLTWTDFRLLHSPMATVITIKPPNKEVLLREKVVTMKYYGNNTFGFDRPKITNYSLWIESNLTAFIRSDNLTANQRCIRIFEHLVEETPAFFEPDSESSYPVYPWFETPWTDGGHPKENSIRCAVRCSFMFGWTWRIHATTIFPAGPDKPDLFITQDARAVIIKIKYDDRLEGAIRDTDIDGYVNTSHARIIKHSEHFKHVRSVRFVAIQLRSNRKVVIRGWTEEIN